MTTPLLRVEQLHFAYDGLPALNGVSLEVGPGEFAALLGQNGSGKTTLAKHFIGLLKPASGRVWVGGQDTSRLAVSDLARTVGYAFQNPDHQIHQATVREEIVFGLRNLGFGTEDTRRRTEAALADFGLEAVAEKPPAILGFGLRRKVALASVFALEPPVLILDEPSGGLDARAAQAVLDQAGRLRAAGHTVLLISHDMRRVAACADRCLILQDGRLLRDGPTRQVFAEINLLQRASLLPPPVTRLAQALAPGLRLGTPLTAPEFHAAYNTRAHPPTSP